ncbi:OsmC family protein [Flavobacterium macacae]|uniref:OsmC family peroxiredoxin n=1 Tax=Flavobacterium macacae TaxID=2488993 RepID=A0A3P3W9W1_9FLAO|nr:OsmC family protein [Flavobacterium macacae]RRJ91117.1 OsmC family peroxiredoxin [Flavobacterium macacae]
MKAINVLGYSRNNEQFVVKTQNADVRISNNNRFPELDGPSPFEYILAGFAGCINAVGQNVAAELGINLKSLQIEITGTVSQEERIGFSKIEIVLKPTTDASLKLLQAWLKLVQQKSPVYDNLINPTPVELILFKEYNYAA